MIEGGGGVGGGLGVDIPDSSVQSEERFLKPSEWFACKVLCQNISNVVC